jgi:hypothetical protein
MGILTLVSTRFRGKQQQHWAQPLPTPFDHMLDSKINEIVMTCGFFAEFFFDSLQIICNKMANFAKTWC